MNIVKVKKTYLLSPFNATDTSFSVVELVDHKDNPLTIANFENLFVLTLRQGNLIEMVLCDGITQNADGTATITVDTNGRHLDAIFPYTGYSSGLDFGSGAEVVNGNDPYTIYQITKAYADALAIAGVPDAGLTVKGILELATEAEFLALTANGTTGAPLVLPANFPYLQRLVKKRVSTEVSTATPTFNSDTHDVHIISALATNITDMSLNFTGTPYLWDIRVIQITATADRTLAWGAKFESGSVYTLPTSILSGQTIRYIFCYNGTKWSLIGFA